VKTAKDNLNSEIGTICPGTATLIEGSTVHESLFERAKSVGKVIIRHLCSTIDVEEETQ